MKNSLIPVILLLTLLASCSSKQPSVADSASLQKKLDADPEVIKYRNSILAQVRIMTSTRNMDGSLINPNLRDLSQKSIKEEFGQDFNDDTNGSAYIELTKLISDNSNTRKIIHNRYPDLLTLDSLTYEKMLLGPVRDSIRQTVLHVMPLFKGDFKADQE
ncbi:MAG: hypothetical protein R3A50_08375 [Saprospiraceae bacterium]